MMIMIYTVAENFSFLKFFQLTNFSSEFLSRLYKENCLKKMF